MFDLPSSPIQTREAWLAEVQKIKDELEGQPEITDEKHAIQLVKDSIITSFKQRVPNNPPSLKLRRAKKFGILFSGGVDSTTLAFLAKQVNLDFTCYTSVIEHDDLTEAHDLERARSAAEMLGLDWKVKKTSLEELHQILPNVIKAIGRGDPLHVSIAAALWQAIDQVKKDSLKYFMTGLGTEQIYAGGNKYRLTDDINKLCWEQIGPVAWDGDILRDMALAKAFGLGMGVPFFSRECIKAAMNISNQLKAKDNYQKYILRLTVHDMGLPQELAFRRNRPTQYGSKFDKAIDKLAKLKGFKYRKDYLESLTD